MIRTFKSKEAEKLFARIRPAKLPGNIQRVALRKLRMLNRAQKLADLRVPPANRLERLSGDRAGHYSIRIHEQWRTCFRWEAGDAFDAEIADDHRA